MTEEIFRKLYSEHDLKTIHIAKWPIMSRKLINKEAFETGELLKKIISTVRKLKSQQMLSLNTETSHMTVYCKKNNVRKRLRKVWMDIKETGKIKRITILKTKQKHITIKLNIRSVNKGRSKWRQGCSGKTRTDSQG